MAAGVRQMKNVMSRHIINRQKTLHVAISNFLFSSFPQPLTVDSFFSFSSSTAQARFTPPAVVFITPGMVFKKCLLQRVIQRCHWGLHTRQHLRFLVSLLFSQQRTTLCGLSPSSTALFSLAPSPQSLFLLSLRFVFCQISFSFFHGTQRHSLRFFFSVSCSTGRAPRNMPAGKYVGFPVATKSGVRPRAVLQTGYDELPPLQGSTAIHVGSLDTYICTVGVMNSSFSWLTRCWVTWCCEPERNSMSLSPLLKLMALKGRPNV